MYWKTEIRLRVAPLCLKLQDDIINKSGNTYNRNNDALQFLFNCQLRNSVHDLSLLF